MTKLPILCSNEFPLDEIWFYSNAPVIRRGVLPDGTVVERPRPPDVRIVGVKPSEEKEGEK